MSAIAVNRSERTLSGALALGMHVLFALLLVFGVTWQQKRSDAPVVVDLWSSLPPQPKPKAEAPPPEGKPEPEPPKPSPPKPSPPKVVEPKAEPKPVPKPDIALKEKAEKERKRKEEERAEQERKRQEKQKAEAKKREEEKKRFAALKEQQAKEKAEAARVAKEQDEALRKLAAQKAAQASAQQRLMDDYMRSVRDKIRRFVIVPPNIQGNPEAEFEVVQIPGGEVLSAKLKRSSGNSAYDAAVERAIHKAQPLPPPPTGFAFNEIRELTLKFRPKE